MLKITVLILALFSLAGCKLAVIVVEGGTVNATSTLGLPLCLEGDNCVIQISDTNYSDSFTATSLPGWEFVRWQAGKDFLCGDLINPTCPISNVLGAGNAIVEAVVASDKTFYIMPIFEPSPPNTYTVGGTVSNLLANNTVTLQDSVHSNSRLVYSNGSWGMPGALPDFESYSVSIITQPLLQNCTVSNSTGNVASANVTDINVSCGPNLFFCTIDAQCPAPAECNTGLGVCYIP